MHLQLRPFVEDCLGPAAAARRGEGYAHKLLMHPGYPGVPATPIEELELSGAGADGDGAADAVLVAIGPEGGWVDFELKLFEEAGFQCVAMGPRILRTDVATTAAVMLVRSTLARSR